MGMQRRVRSCSNPHQSTNGDKCLGEARDDRMCIPGACADGAWSVWEMWGSCSESCEGGLQSRIRTCSNPRPSMLGRYCDGSPEQTRLCNKHQCISKKQNVAFTAYDLDTNSTGWTTLLFRSVYVNDGNSFDTKTGKFTCKIPGVYFFSVTLSKGFVKIPFIYAYVRINNHSKLVIYWVAYSEEKFEYEGTPLTQSGTFRLYENDVVYVESVSSNLCGTAYSTFTGYLISPDH